MQNADFTRLDSSDHMLEWIFSDPKKAIWHEIEKILIEQVETSELKRLLVTSTPDWLTTGKPTDGEDGPISVNACAFAFEFELDVTSEPDQTHTLAGVFSFVALNLHLTKEKRYYRSWFDVDGRLAQLGSEGELKSRFLDFKAEKANPGLGQT